MKKLLPADALIEMTDFPYSAPHPWRYGCNPSEPNCRELLDSLLFTIDDPETPDGMAYVMDIVGLEEWYDQVADEEERAEYNCPTVYDYLACEVGRYVTPLRGVRE